MKKEKNNCKQAIKKMQLFKVGQLDNKNQFVIYGDHKRFFQSYESLIAVYDNLTKKLILGCDWNYGNTTKKHLYIFIKDYCYLPEIDAALYNTNNKTKTIIKLIKDGVIEYDPEMR